MITHAFKRPVVLALALGLLALEQVGVAKDAFGLDQFKVRIETITKPQNSYATKYGTPLSVYAITPTQNPRSQKSEPLRFLIQGGLHGNELLSSEFVAWLAQRFANGESLLNTLNNGHIAIDFVPYANPDGTIQYTRYNANKVNLNRNFDVLWGMTREHPGPAPFSEPETRAIRDLVLKRKYTAAIDVHGYVNWIVLPTAPSEKFKELSKISSDRQALYAQWDKAVRRETAKQLPGYEIKTAGELGDGGAFEDFAWWSGGSLATCLELFTDSRHVMASLADTIINFIAPKTLSANKQHQTRQSDTFIAYENYVHSLFNEAITIKSKKDSQKKDVVSN